MKTFLSIFIIGVFFITCKQKGNATQTTSVTSSIKKDTLIRLNDTLSIYYASYNNEMKLWYNLYIINKKDTAKVGRRNDYFGVGSELFYTLSPNAKYIIVDGIIKGYVHENEVDSSLHENYMCSIIHIGSAEILKQLQESCDGKWNKKSQWISSDGKMIFDGEVDRARIHRTFNENIDTIPEILKAFIPAGYSAINISSGDANLDGFADKILVLRKDSEEMTSNFAEGKPDKRPLLLLLGQPGNSYKLAFRNDNAVDCIDCGGDDDPFTGITIKNGYFSIEHGISGGPQHWEQVTTFKYDKLKKNWFLYKDHCISYSINVENSKKIYNDYGLPIQNEKLETVKDFGIISFSKYDTYKDEKK